MSDDQTHGDLATSPFGRPRKPVTKTNLSFKALREKSGKTKKSLKSKKEEPTTERRTEWLLPELADVPQRFRAKARHIAQTNPDNYRELLWQAVELEKHGGGDDYDGHHVSLQGICSIVVRIGLIDEDVESPSYKGFIKKMIDEYDHPNPEKQVSMAMAKALDKDNNQDFEVSEQYGFDADILKQHEPTKLNVLTDESPYDKASLAAVTPRQFTQMMFTPDVLNIATKNAKRMKQGYIAMSQGSQDFATILDPHEDEKFFSAATGTQVPDDFSGYNFLALGVFDTASADNGRRLNDNVAKSPFMVLEMDHRDKYFQQCFTTFAMVVAKFAPLIAVVDSGGKSVHYWFYVGSTDPKVVETFIKRAIQHGADRSVLKTKNRLVRMANVEASEDDRRHQTLLYFDPDRIANDLFVDWKVEQFEEYMKFLRNVDCYYNDGEWFYRNPANEFIKIDRVFLGTLCNTLGCWNWKMDGQVETPANEYLVQRMNSHYVKAVYNRVAGYRSGVHTLRDGRRILVRENPRVLDLNDISDRWQENIEVVLRECFHGDEYHYFMGWLASSVRDFYNDGAEKGVSIFSQSLYLNIVGKSNSGKSFILEHLMTPLFGMGSFDASGLFKEENDFNNTEAGNELLFLDDSKEIKETEGYRKWHGEFLKEFCVSNSGYIHPKGKDKTKIKLFRRLVRLMNYNKIHTLPNITEESIADKVLVILCENEHKNEDGDITPNERSESWGKRMETCFKQELPSFFNYLINGYEIPEHIKPASSQARFPVRAYKNADVLEQMKTGSRTTFIADCIKSASLPPTGNRDGRPCVEATVDELHRMFIEHLPSSYKSDYQKQFYRSQNLQATLREMRYNEDKFVFESVMDELTPKDLDGDAYWRITVPDMKKENKANESLFNKEK